MKKGMGCLLLFLIFCSVVPGQAAQDIFVSIGPQKWLVDRVGGNLVNTRLLVKKGQDPHTFEPTPKQIAALSQASIWFTMGIAFEELLAGKIEGGLSELQVVDIAHHVQKLAIVDVHHDDNHQKNREKEGDNDHGGGHDPHVWLSPSNLQQMADEIAKSLADTDPSNAAVYEKNRVTVNLELEQLNARITKMLAPYKGASFYVYHPSFGYFADSFGLKQYAIELGGKSPSPRQIARLVGKARAENVRVIFVQPQFDPKSARAIASAIDGEVVPLDALAEDVFDNLEIMAEKVKAAFTR